MGLFSNKNNNGLPLRKVEFVPAKDGYLDHYEVLEKKLIGWEPLMTWHPMSGDRPMMFKSPTEAEKFIADENKIITDREEALKNAIDFRGHKILFIPANKEYIEHYEVLEKKTIGWEPVMTWHPMSGDRPMMFDSQADAEKYVRVYILGESQQKESVNTVKNNMDTVLEKTREPQEKSKKFRI
jgi:hypothetical protein